MNTELFRPLLSSLDKLGLTDQLTDTRTYLARAVQITEQRYAGAEQARTARAGLASQIARGEITLEQAAAQSGASDPWIAIPSNHLDTVVGQLAAAATTELERMADRALRDDAAGVYRALQARAADAVQRATTAASAAVNIPSVVDALQPLMWDTPEASRGRRHDDVLNSGDVAKAVGIPEAAEVHADSRRSTAWNTAAAAAQEFSDVHAAARMLRQATYRRVDTMRQAMYAAPVSPDALGILDMLPAPLHLAITAGLGWGPGLHGAELFDPAPAEPRPSTAARVLDVIRRAG